MLLSKFRHFLFLLGSLASVTSSQAQTAPDEIQFVRQSVRRFLFDNAHSLPLAALKPAEIVGLTAMYPVTYGGGEKADIALDGKQLIVSSENKSETAFWFSGFNPFVTYTIDLESATGSGTIGFEFSDPEKSEQFRLTIHYNNSTLTDIRQKVFRSGKLVSDKSIVIEIPAKIAIQGKLIVQLLGSGLNVYLHNDGLPAAVAQSDFATEIDLRDKKRIGSFQTHLIVETERGAVRINEVKSGFNSGMGLADIRAITYEDGSPLLEHGRLWYTMTIRGRALPHPIQGVFSLNTTLFDLKLEGIIVFDREDGLLRNEVASHIFYDRKEKLWRGITTGFSAYALPGEQKQLLAVESRNDPRFGFSIMAAKPFGIVGDIEDPHIIYDAQAKKWRILTCENKNGYKAIMMESLFWNKNYTRIAGPVKQNSTGTSIQRIGGKYFCFSGSQEREIFIYTYPDLRDAGTLRMDLPPWDEKSGTRVWPNVVELPEGYPVRYVALMMDRFNYPGIKGPNWTYGALYLYYGNVSGK